MNRLYDVFGRTVVRLRWVVLAVAAAGSPRGTQVEAIGVGLALGILMDTFLVRTLLIPSVVVLIGRRNWWPSHLSTESSEAGPAGRYPDRVPAGIGGSAT